MPLPPTAPRRRRRLTLGLAAAAVSALAFLAAGCGSDEDATAQWADGLCTAIGTWTETLSGIASSLADGGVPTKETLQTAVDDAREATDTLRQDLEALGEPELDSADQARQALADLSQELSATVDTVTKAFEDASGLQELAEAASTAATAITTMSNQISATVSELQGLDPEGELSDAFGDTESCQGITTGP